MKFSEEKGLGFCGLACVLCSSADCPGCKERGCKQGCDCSIYKCATQKGVDGCYECADFPCDEKMLQSPRMKAFNHYAREHGKDALLSRLQCNHKEGISYHKEDGTSGDYDMLTTEKEISDLLAFGRQAKN